MFLWDVFYVILDPPKILSLNCFVDSDRKEVKKIFLVQVPETENVGFLRSSIKKEKVSLKNVDISYLDLIRVSIPVNGDFEENLKSIESEGELAPTLVLSRVFPRVEEGHLHIFVRTSTDRESY